MRESSTVSDKSGLSKRRGSSRASQDLLAQEVWKFSAIFTHQQPIFAVIQRSYLHICCVLPKDVIGITMSTLRSVLVVVLLLSIACMPVQALTGSGPTGSSAESLKPVTVRSVDMLRRYLNDLADRHQVPPPEITVITRAGLGEYFLALSKKLSELPPKELSDQDYYDIGLLSEEFDDVFRVIKGRVAMQVLRGDKEAPPETAAIPQKLAEFSDRFAALERIKLSGDITVFPQQDWGRSVRESMASNMRGRLNITAKVFEGAKESRLGDGYMFMRLTAAAGRFFPRNKYLMSPTNDINDAAASPFNSGLNDVQLANLVINNNNSNSVRPTVSMEQLYYTQDVRLSQRWKGNYKAGLIYFGNMFDNNNFANSEMLQYANTAFVNSISWRPNFVGPATVLSVERPIFKERAFLRGTAGMISLTNRDYFGSVGGNYELQLGHHFRKKEGNLRAGLWWFDFRGGSAKPFVTPPDIFGTSMLSILPGGVTTGSRPVGMYLNFDQRIWKDIGIWGRYAMNDKQIGEVILGGLLSSRASWSCGAEIPAKLFLKKRTDDVLGLAYGQVLPYSREAVTPATPAFVSLDGVPATTLDQVNRNLGIINPGPHHRSEKILEVYYRYQLNKNVSISPDFQYIWSPGATGPQPSLFVMGTRLTVTF